MDLEELCGGWMDGWMEASFLVHDGGWSVCGGGGGGGASRVDGGAVVEWWWSMEPRCMDDDDGMRAEQKVCTHAHAHSLHTHTDSLYTHTGLSSTGLLPPSFLLFSYSYWVGDVTTPYCILPSS